MRILCSLTIPTPTNDLKKADYTFLNHSADVFQPRLRGNILPTLCVDVFKNIKYLQALHFLCVHLSLSITSHLMNCQKVFSSKNKFPASSSCWSEVDRILLPTSIVTFKFGASLSRLSQNRHLCWGTSVFIGTFDLVLIH